MLQWAHSACTPDRVVLIALGEGEAYGFNGENRHQLLSFSKEFPDTTSAILSIAQASEDGSTRLLQGTALFLEDTWFALTADCAETCAEEHGMFLSLGDDKTSSRGSWHEMFPDSPFDEVAEEPPTPLTYTSIGLMMDYLEVAITSDSTNVFLMLDKEAVSSLEAGLDELLRFGRERQNATQGVLTISEPAPEEYNLVSIMVMAIYQNGGWTGLRDDSAKQIHKAIVPPSFVQGELIGYASWDKACPESPVSQIA